MSSARVTRRHQQVVAPPAKSHSQLADAESDSDESSEDEQPIVGVPNLEQDISRQAAAKGVQDAEMAALISEYQEEAEKQQQAQEAKQKLSEAEQELQACQNLFIQAVQNTKPDPEAMAKRAAAWWSSELPFGKFKGLTPKQVLQQTPQEGKKTPEEYLRWYVKSILHENDPDFADFVYRKTMSRREPIRARPKKAADPKPSKPKPAPKPKRKRAPTKAEMEEELQKLRKIAKVSDAAGSEVYSDDVVVS